MHRHRDWDMPPCYDITVWLGIKRYESDSEDPSRLSPIYVPLIDEYDIVSLK